MKMEIEDPAEIEAVQQYRQNSLDSKAVVQREAAALDVQRRMAAEANSMSVGELSKSPEHRAALMAEVVRVMKQSGQY